MYGLHDFAIFGNDTGAFVKLNHSYSPNCKDLILLYFSLLYFTLKFLSIRSILLQSSTIDGSVPSPSFAVACFRLCRSSLVVGGVRYLVFQPN